MLNFALLSPRNILVIGLLSLMTMFLFAKAKTAIDGGGSSVAAATS